MAALPPPGADGVLYLVDISGWIHRAFHALPPLTGPSGEPTGAVSGVAGMLVRLLDGRRPAYLGVAADPCGPSFRQALFPGYKAARPPLHPDLALQIARVRQLIEQRSEPLTT